MKTIVESVTLREAVREYKSCHFTTDGIAIESKLGRVIFAFASVHHKISMTAKRLSGNGKILVNGKSVVVASKISQTIDLDFVNEISITRPSDGVGEVVILGINLHTEEIEGEDLSQNWKAVLSRCSEHKCLRLANGKLFAVEGAYISSEKAIHSIETSPPNAFVRQNDRIKFTAPCEIVSMQVDTTAPVILKSNDVFSPRVAPVPIAVASETVTPKLVDRPTNVFVPRKKEQISMSNPILFDSTLSREFSPAKFVNSKTVKSVRSNNIDYLVLRKGGTYSVPTSFVQPNMEYVVVVNVKKLNGNGRVHVEITPGMTASFIATGTMNDHYVGVRSGTIPDSGAKVSFTIPDTGSGEVIISRIQIISGIQWSGQVVPDSEDEQMAPPMLSFAPRTILPDRKFVVVIPSYKNSNWCERNIQSVIDQDYKKYRCIFVDDCSPDDTFEKVSKVVEASGKKNLFTLSKNPERKGALCNLYNMIHSCDDDEIIVTLDGDDWMAHNGVLSHLNEVYTKNDVWMTYGQYQNHPDWGIGISKQIPAQVIDTNNFRRHEWCSSHMRTFYSWLFKKIELKDMMYEGKFFTMTWDFVMMFPMLEMSGHRSKFVPEILYTYNLENPINDHKVDVKLQQHLDRYVRNMPKYKRLTKAPKLNVDKVSVGLMIISTGKYSRFIQGLISSADNYFLNDESVDVKYYVFSDQQSNIKSKRSVEQIYIEHRPFPFASMDRFEHFTNHADKLSTQDYIYYIDVDCLFVDNVSIKEILGNLVGVTHCGYLNKQGPVESDPKSCLYVDPKGSKKYKVYYGGGFSGGKTEKYLELAQWCRDAIRQDVSNGVMPIYHDETALNRYFLDHEPDITLDPGYHHPQSDVARYKKMWHPFNFKAKIMLLDKNHKEIRS